MRPPILVGREEVNVDSGRRRRMRPRVWWPLAVAVCALLPRHGLAQTAASGRTSFDFVANRAHAVVHIGQRLVIDPQSPSFLKYIDGNWKTSWLLAAEGGRTRALVNGLSALLFVPLDRDPDGVLAAGRDLELALTLRALAPAQRLSVFWNERPVGTNEVGAASGVVRFTVPVALVKPGENRIRLTFKAAGAAPGGKRAAAAVERITLGPAGGTEPAANTEALLVRPRADGSALVLPGPSRLSFYVQVPARARLVVQYNSPAAGAHVAVRVAADGAPLKTLFDGPSDPQVRDGNWDLGDYADRAVRLDFACSAGAVAWTAPRLVVTAAAPTAMPTPAPTFDRIYVWMVDTLRADKVHVYNPRSPVATPTFDAFAADSTRFAWAQVPGTWSLPSHASYLTGVYPSVHKAVAHEARLSREVPFVAEQLKRAGYKTALFSSNGYISSKWGFDRGWDESRNFIRESLPNGADYIWKTASPWVLGPKAASKQFVYFATVEPHVIYNPKKEFLARYWNKPYTGPIKPALTGVQLGLIKSGKLKITETDKLYLEALHNAEITQADDVFATFLADLKRANLYDRAAIIVISDHGDEFWDHGDVGHAQSVYQELVHVPMMIRAPGLFPIGKVVSADVEAMDLYPTLLALAGVAPGEAVQGTSLVPLAYDELAQVPRAALTQNVAISRGLKAGRYRIVDAGPQRVELYDEVKDPREQTNVAESQPLALRQMRNVLSLLLGYENRWHKPTWGTAANVTEAFNAAATAAP